MQIDNSEIINKMKYIKGKIEKLIEQGHLKDAKEALDTYEKNIPRDADIWSMRAVIFIMEGNPDGAEIVIKEGLKNDSCTFDLLFNLAYISELRGKYQEAAYLYLKAGTVAITEDNKTNIEIALQNIKILDSSIEIKIKKRLVFFVKRGKDRYIGDIVDGLSDEYWTRKIIVDNYKQIDEGMKWADICWFEWCDELIIYGSRLNLAMEKRIICRLHSYEAFSDHLKIVNWDNVNSLIFVAEHIKENVLSKIDIPKDKVTLIYNGVDLNKFPFKQREKGFNIAYVGYINYEKSPMLLIHAFKAIHDKDKRYKLYIAGEYEEERYLLYFNQMINELGLENSVIYQGWQNDINSWLEDKNFILSASPLEGNPVGIMEAMARGVKPIIHNFVGAKEQFINYVWNTIDECVDMVCLDQYEPFEYRDVIAKKFSLDIQLEKLKIVIDGLLSKKTIVEIVVDYLDKKEIPLKAIFADLTVLIPCFNRGKMLREDMDNYFKLGNQNKLIVDDCSLNEVNELKIIEKTKEKYNAEILYKNRNEGLALARWTGLNNVTTKYTGILDDDDMIFCLDEGIAGQDIKKLDEDIVLLVPRYVVNITDNKVYVGYDRNCYNQKISADVLQSIASTGEVKALLAGGSIGKTETLKKYALVKNFIVAEDIVMLTRMLANNTEKKVITTESLVHVRRFSENSLSHSITPSKLGISLISQAVACYYCLYLNLATEVDVLKWMKDRGSLIQQIYDFGDSFETELIAYLKGEISEEVFIHFLALHDIKPDNGLDEFAPELLKMRALLYKEPIRSKIFEGKSKEELPLVSVIIPTYNRKDMLKRAIDQALKQDYPNIEVIVTDNCSEDGTRQMVEREYKDRKGLVYNYNKKNLGAIGNYHNAFYNIAKGKYCLTISDDDYLIDSNYISKAVEMLEEHNDIAFVFANEYHNNENIGKVYKIDREMPRIIDGIDLFLNFTSEKYPRMPNINNVILRASNAKKINYLKVNPNCLAGDLSMLLRLLLTGNAGFINNTVLVYTLHKSSISLNVEACLPEDLTINDKAIETARNDVNELIKIASLAHELKRIDSKVLDEWLNFRIWKYMYYRINESAKNISECKSLLSYINNEFPKLYSSLNSVAERRFGI